jgi:hypothetical protein
VIQSWVAKEAIGLARRQASTVRRLDAPARPTHGEGVPELGRTLVVLGLVVVVAGLVMMVLPRVPWLGRLPGDINIEGGSFSVHVPLVTCLVISLVATLIVNLFFRR